MNKTKLRIHIWPEKILRKKCRKVEKADAKIKSLLEEMLSLMRVSGGAGLAANQAGLDLSLIVIEVEKHTFKLVNPRITRKEGSISFFEGCLSFPGLELKIERANKVWISAMNEEGESVEIKAEGFLAVVFQHEIDHIEGVVFVDRISFWQRLKAYPGLRKIIRGQRGKDGVSKSKDKH